tara:strand:+ start:647 stop:994 length:348 start_codon:yes stop_codon:yes gene_type:complete
MISLNIGGTVFITSLETLKSNNCFFSALVSNTNDKQHFFVDRDPTHFIYILNYLRGSHFLPSNPDVLKQLQIEADFYCLTELSKNILDKLKNDLQHAQSIEVELRLLRQKIQPPN